MTLHLTHVCPRLLNLHSDVGNIIALRKRCEWRGIKLVVNAYHGDGALDLSTTDLCYIGGGSVREGALAANMLHTYADDIRAYVEGNGVLLAVCGGFPLLGRYYLTGDQRVNGLGVLDMYTEWDNRRLVGDTVLRSRLCDIPVTGFVNHNGRTYTDAEPFGVVERGYGNRDESDAEGVLYKNLIGTYLHGPLLPKNPQLTDHIIAAAARRREPGFALPALDDGVERTANAYIVNGKEVRDN